MAIMALGATVGTTLTAALGSGKIAPVTDAIAVLVADGASPTQAHVTTLNTAYTALLANDVVLLINSSSNVSTKNKLREILRAFMFQIEGSNLLT